MTGRDYPPVQIVTVADLLGGKRVEMPAQKFVPEHPTLLGLG